MFNTLLLQEVRKDMESALSMVEAKHNMTFKIGRITYSGPTFTCKLEAAIAVEGEEANIEEAQWNKLCQRYGFQKDDLGKSFQQRGSRYTITGLAPRSTKYPVLAKRDFDGAIFKFTPRGVIAALNVGA